MACFSAAYCVSCDRFLFSTWHYVDRESQSIKLGLAKMRKSTFVYVLIKFYHSLLTPHVLVKIQLVQLKEGALFNSIVANQY